MVPGSNPGGPTNFMQSNKIAFSLILLLSAFAIYCSLIIGISWDEHFAQIHALAKIDYIKSFGQDAGYLKYEDFHNPGFFEVPLAFFSNLLPTNWIYEGRHLLNLLLSFATLLGAYLVVKDNFDKKIALITILLCLLNPFFFGLMSVTVRDMPTCFAYVWLVYFISNYIKNFNKDEIKTTIGLGLVIGFGIGTRLGFVINFLPIFIMLIYFFLINKNQLQNKIVLFKSLKDIFIIIILSVSVLFLFWFNAYENPLYTLIESIKQTINLTKGPETGIINGDVYNTIDTPRNYLATFYLNRFPIFLIILNISFLILLFFKNSYFSEKYKLFNKKIIFNFLIIFIPVSIAIIIKVTLYDDFRLFLFLIPPLSLFSAISLNFLIENFNKHVIYKGVLVLVLSSFLFFLERFIRLTPYQYDFSNYLRISYIDTKDLYQHDFWATSYKELVKKIKQDEQFANKKFTVSVCGGNLWQIVYEFNKDKNFKKNIFYYHKFVAHKADYMIMINRLGSKEFKNKKCFDRFKGVDIKSVERLGVIYSVFRKI